MNMEGNEWERERESTEEKVKAFEGHIEKQTRSTGGREERV